MTAQAIPTTASEAIASSRRVLTMLLVAHLLTVATVLLAGTPEEPGAEQWSYFASTARTQGPFLWGGIALVRSTSH